jgi:hypothetical protein
MRRVVIGALLASAGCAAVLQQSVHSVEIMPNYQPSGFSAFAASGPAVEFVGPLPGGATPEAVAATLRLPGWWPQTPFRPLAPGEGGQRIVIAFGAAGDPAALCENPSTPAATPGRLEASAAYCRGRSAASFGRLSDQRDLVPGDPAFAASMGALLSEITPSREPFESRRENRFDDCLLPVC